VIKLKYLSLKLIRIDLFLSVKYRDKEHILLQAGVPRKQSYNFFYEIHYRL
jgi:hypothetical protein